MNIKNPKILILLPSFNLVGGVANYYLVLKNYWSFDISYIFYGKRKFIPALFTFCFDLINFSIKLIFNRPDVVIINPSLRKYQMFRDGLYIRIAFIFNIKVIVFIHGWSNNYYEKLLYKNKYIKNIFNKSKLIYVLAQDFKDKLIDI